MNTALFLPSSRITASHQAHANLRGSHRYHCLCVSRPLSRIKMKAILILLSVFTAAALSACNRSVAETAHAREQTPAASYKAGHGIQLTAFAREFNRVAVAEFTARVPAAAVLRTVEGTFVYVQNGDWFLRTPVLVERIGAVDSYALKEGLYEGDRIVVGGVQALWLAELHFLRAGQACAHEG